jgi:hypothetical protein
MPEGFSKPLDDTLRVFEDYDTKVIQLAKTGTVIEEDPEILAYQYIEVDRDLCHAGGEEYIQDILQKDTNGRLWLKLHKLVKRWQDHGGITSQLYALATHRNGFASEGELEFQDFHVDFQILFEAVELECKKALELRRKIKDTMTDNFFGRETLYHYMVLNQRYICDLRWHLKHIAKDSLYAADAKTRDDQIWEAQKHWENLPGVVDLDSIEAVQITVGAVSPDFVVDRRAMERELVECREHGSRRFPSTPDEIRDFQISHCISYGNSAPLEWEYFLDERDGLEWALRIYKESQIMLGFMLDRQANALGATAWDFLRGDPTMRHAKINE